MYISASVYNEVKLTQNFYGEKNLPNWELSLPIHRQRKKDSFLTSRYRKYMLEKELWKIGITCVGP